MARWADCKCFGCCCCGCHSDEVARDLVERGRQTVADLAHSGGVVVVAGDVSYVANGVNSVTVSVQCPPNWAPRLSGNDTLCGTCTVRVVAPRLHLPLLL